MSVYVCGLEFDDQLVSVEKLKSNFTIQFSKAFCSVRSLQLGRLTNGQINILTNEVLRGRLDTKDIEAVKNLSKTIQHIVDKGYTYKDIVILRSLYFGFDEIMEFAKQNKTISKIIETEGIENPEIETIYGLTSLRSVSWYVPYAETKKVKI